LLSCLALLRTFTYRGDQLAAAVRSLHDEGLSGDDLVLETWARANQLLAEGGVEAGAAAADGTADTCAALPPSAGPLARAIHGARETCQEVDFCLAEIACTLKVENEDVPSEAGAGAALSRRSPSNPLKWSQLNTSKTLKVKLPANLCRQSGDGCVRPCSEEWESAVCTQLDAWAPVPRPASGPGPATPVVVDYLVTDAAATAVQAVARGRARQKTLGNIRRAALNSRNEGWQMC